MLVKVVAPVDQHQAALTGIARHSTLFPVTVATDIDYGNDLIKREACRVCLVIGEVTVKVLGNEVAPVNDGNRDGIVLSSGNERVSLFLGQDRDDSACLLDGVAQLMDIIFVAVQIDDALADNIKDVTCKIYSHMGCSGVVRADYILADDGLYFLEVNTIPGMTSASLVPKMVRAAGMDITDFLTDIIENG